MNADKRISSCLILLLTAAMPAAPLFSAEARAASVTLPDGGKGIGFDDLNFAPKLGSDNRPHYFFIR